jgi:DNA-binding NarL/FixJ family response regulator
MDAKIRVLLADEQTLPRRALHALLSSVKNVEVVGEVATIADLTHLARRLDADVVLIDQEMPNTLQLIEMLRKTLPAAEIIVMARHLDMTRAVQAIETGATGYVLKDIPVANLVAALHSARDGRAVVDPMITRKLVERLAVLRRRHKQSPEGLTSREVDILSELAKGSTDQEIAAKLVVTKGTVKTHIRHVLQKLGARNRTQAVALVLRSRFME